MALFRWTVAIFFVFVVVFVGVRNAEPVKVDYFFGSVSLPMFLWMAGFILVGALLSAVVGLADQLRLRSGIRRMKKRSRDLEGELATLRNLPPPAGTVETDEEDVEE